MSESDRYVEFKVKKWSLGDDNNALIALISFNAILFVSLGLIQIIYYLIGSTSSAFEYEILRWVVLPAKLSDLATKPWTIISQMFVFSGFLVTLIHLLWLWAFGSILQQISGNQKLIPLYIYGGIAGALFFIAANYAFPQLRSQIEYATLYGGGASIMAVATAVTFLAPNFRLFRMLNGGIPLWILTVVFVIIDLSGTRNWAVQAAHLGGGVMGIAFAFALERNIDLSAWMVRFYNWFNDLCNPDKKKKPATQKFYYETGKRSPFSKSGVVTQERIDQILDKINQVGFAGLSSEEKNILNKAREIDL